MRHRSLLGVLALAPMALNVNVATAMSPIIAPLCSGGAAARGIAIPQAPSPSRNSEQGCCIKGCHVGSSRKRATRDI